MVINRFVSRFLSVGKSEGILGNFERVMDDKFCNLRGGSIIFAGNVELLKFVTIKKIFQFSLQQQIQKTRSENFIVFSSKINYGYSLQILVNPIFIIIF